MAPVLIREIKREFPYLQHEFDGEDVIFTHKLTEDFVLPRSVLPKKLKKYIRRLTGDPIPRRISSVARLFRVTSGCAVKPDDDFETVFASHDLGEKIKKEIERKRSVSWQKASFELFH